MRGQIRGLEQAQRNVQDGISFAQTAEGAMNEVSSMLTRMKELSVQQLNDTYSAGDKSNIKAELGQLGGQIDAILSNTKFNGIAISGGSVKIQADDNAFVLTVKGIDSTQIRGLTSGVTLSATTNAIEKVAKQRANLGAMQNRMEYTSNNLGTTVENLTASESRIRDTDMAKEMVALSKNNILLQASQSMLSQANSAPQGVLSLLR